MLTLLGNGIHPDKTSESSRGEGFENHLNTLLMCQRITSGYQAAGKYVLTPCASFVPDL